MTTSRACRPESDRPVVPMVMWPTGTPSISSGFAIRLEDTDACAGRYGPAETTGGLPMPHRLMQA